jgi:hypothetical protein
MLHLVAVSFSSKAAISAGSVGVFPVDAQLRAYGFIIKESRFWTAFLISVERTVLGITINMLLVILAAYPLSKPSSFSGQIVYVWFFLIAICSRRDDPHLSGRSLYRAHRFDIRVGDSGGNPRVFGNPAAELYQVAAE